MRPSSGPLGHLLPEGEGLAISFRICCAKPNGALIVFVGDVNKGHHISKPGNVDLRARPEAATDIVWRMAADEDAIPSERPDRHLPSQTRRVRAPGMLLEQELLASPDIVKKEHQHDLDGGR